MIHKALHRNLKIKQHQLHKTRVNSCTSMEYAVPDVLDVKYPVIHKQENDGIRLQPTEHAHGHFLNTLKTTTAIQISTYS